MSKICIQSTRIVLFAGNLESVSYQVGELAFSEGGGIIVNCFLAECDESHAYYRR